MTEAPRNRRRRLAAVGLVAGLGVGGVAGVALGSPGLSGAQEETTTTVPDTPAAPDEGSHRPGDWIEETLAPLVEAGTITQAQADAVTKALVDARPEGGPGGPHGHGRMGVRLEAAAAALGMTEDELRTALRDGSSLAEVAAARKVDVQKVIDALVADATTRLDEKVSSGDLTQEEADQRKADLTERITAMVNGERPAGPGGPRGGHWHERGEGPGHRGDDGTDGTDDTTTTAPDAPTTTEAG